MKKRAKDSAKKLLETRIEKVRELTGEETKEVAGGGNITGCTLTTSC